MIVYLIWYKKIITKAGAKWLLFYNCYIIFAIALFCNPYVCVSSFLRRDSSLKGLSTEGLLCTQGFLSTEEPEGPKRSAMQTLAVIHRRPQEVRWALAVRLVRGPWLFWRDFCDSREFRSPSTRFWLTWAFGPRGPSFHPGASWKPPGRGGRSAPLATSMCIMYSYVCTIPSSLAQIQSH